MYPTVDGRKPNKLFNFTYNYYISVMDMQVLKQNTNNFASLINTT